MANNLFEAFRQKKDTLIQLAKKAKSFGWIDEKREKEIITKLDTDTLTIGVIGQMKCGKSTFLNAFVFEDDILPSATTPMTASLSIITYGESAKVVAEFYSKDEWIEQCTLAEQPLQGLSDFEASRVKAAKELILKSAPIKNTIEDYFGKTCEDSLDNIVEYVGADGKYVSITKSVKIYYPKDYLKGVEIVDTPGFNDPIVSRELRTKEFLKKADVVVMMLYAGRPFDSTDRTILFENVKQCGIGKIIIGINKYDIPYEKGDSPDVIKQYVIDQIREECHKCNDETMLDILNNSDPLLLSAEMALLSKLPMTKVSSNSAYNYAFKRYASELGICGQLQLRNMSNLDKVAEVIKVMIEQEKYGVLLKKPLNSILAAGSQKYDKLISEITNINAEIKYLSTPDDELEEKEMNLSKAERRLTRKIEGLSEDLNIAVAEVSRKGRNEVEDAFDSCCKKMDQVVENVGTFQNFDSINPRLEQILMEFQTRKLKRLVEQIADDIKRKLKSTTRDFFVEADEIINRFVPDIDSRDFVKEVERSINLQIEDESIFSAGKNEEESSGIGGVLLNVAAAVVCGAIGLALLRGFKFAFKGINHKKNKIAYLKEINSLRKSFDAQPYLDTILIGKENVINLIKKKFLDELINPLIEKIKDCRSSLLERDEKRLKSKKQSEQLESSKHILEEQINEINSLKGIL